MLDYSLGQTLLVAPDVPYARIAATLAALGWREEHLAAHPPLVAGEPEVASWSWQGRKPFVVYSYNPVVQLRILDVASVPPVLRGAIAQSLPLLDEPAIRRGFTSSDAKARLRSLWAVQVIERLDFEDEIERMARDPEPILAEQAIEVQDRLAAIDEARLETLTGLRLLAEAAPQLIRRLGEPGFAASLKPTEADLPVLFDADLKAPLRDAVNAIHAGRLQLSPLEPEASIEVFAAPAGLLRWANPVSEKFPRGYRDIAGWMNPQRIWLAWTVTTPRGGTVRYDGLAWLDGHWAWLPKIYRYLAPYLLGPGGTSARKH
jgi:hypothetical protein